MGRIISREFPVLGLSRKDHNYLHAVNQEEVETEQHVTTLSSYISVALAMHVLTR